MNGRESGKAALKRSQRYGILCVCVVSHDVLTVQRVTAQATSSKNAIAAILRGEK